MSNQWTNPDFPPPAVEAELILPENFDPARLLWRRLENELPEEYRLFKYYCHMVDAPSDNRIKLKTLRSIKRLAAQLRIDEKDTERLATRNDWIRRVRAYDDCMIALEQEKREIALESEAQKWAKRRLAQREAEWNNAEKLRKRAEQMLTVALFTDTLEEIEEEATEEGIRVVTIIRRAPLEWKASDIAKFFEVASKLGRLATGMNTEQKRITIDVGSLNDDELERLAEAD